MSAIEAITRTCKTMSDGTLRLTVDISPIHAQDAFKLFGMPDVPMAIARLTIDASKQSAQAETIAADKPKGGALARLAGMWCAEPNFWEWLNTLDQGLLVESEDDAKNDIYDICSIESRAELDNNPEAAERFHKFVREPYSEYLRNI